MNQARDRVTAGELDKTRYKMIDQIIKFAEIRDFKPLLYVIPFAAVESILTEVAVQDRRDPLVPEYVIRRLPRSLFDVVEL